MPAIKFSTADTLRASLLKDGWYSFEVLKVADPRKSKNGDGVVYDVSLVLIDNVNVDMNGKELSHYFGFSKGKGYGLDIVAAVLGVSLDALANKEFFPETFAGQKIDGHVIVDVYEGRQNNKIDAFLPYKKGVSLSAPF